HEGHVQRWPPRVSRGRCAGPPGCGPSRGDVAVLLERHDREPEHRHDAAAGAGPGGRHADRRRRSLQQLDGPLELGQPLGGASGGGDLGAAADEQRGGEEQGMGVHGAASAPGRAPGSRERLFEGSCPGQAWGGAAGAPGTGLSQPGLGRRGGAGPRSARFRGLTGRVRAAHRPDSRADGPRQGCVQA
ncbi:MAG: hypothetical protein ACK559_02385, partial [bacterium]